MLLKSIFFFKQRLDREILIGSLFSGLFLCFLDFLVYQFPVAGAEIPVGMLAAILGSCVLCYMVIFENYLKQKLGKKNTPR
jgi:ABC-type Fe3+-siderophore transport system permease subunit